MASVDVSVIVPVFNAEDFLSECLDGVTAQSGISLEVLCVNDGSTDSSLAILQEYSSRDPRVRVIDRPNGGASAARNAGLREATGRYICFLDSDDYWRGDELAGLVGRADSDDLDVLLFDAEPFREPGVHDDQWGQFATYYSRSREYSEVVSGPELAATMRRNHDYLPSACLYLVRRALVDDIALQFRPGITHEDNIATFALLLNAGRAAHCLTSFYARRVRAGSISTVDDVAASFRGYFISFLDMSQILSGRTFDPPTAVPLGRIVYQVLRNSYTDFLRLPAGVAEAQLHEFDTDPRATAMTILLSGWRHENNQRIKQIKASSAQLAKVTTDLERATAETARAERATATARAESQVLRGQVACRDQMIANLEQTVASLKQVIARQPPTLQQRVRGLAGRATYGIRLRMPKAGRGA